MISLVIPVVNHFVDVNYISKVCIHERAIDIQSRLLFRVWVVSYISIKFMKHYAESIYKRKCAEYDVLSVRDINVYNESYVKS